MNTERWATVALDLHPSVGAFRHLVPREGVTSACGATGLPASVWRANKSKPLCPHCLRYGVDDAGRAS